MNRLYMRKIKLDGFFEYGRLRKGYGYFMKKWMIYLCLAVLALGTSACGKKDNSDGSSAEMSSEESTVAEVQPQESTDQGEQPNDVAGEWSDEMMALRNAVVEELGEDYWPEMSMPADVLEMQFGLTSDMYTDYMGEMPMMSTKVDTLLIVKAAEGKADAVEEALQNYRTDQIENSFQYPMNVGKVQGSMVEVMGDYICFVQLGGDTMDYEDGGDEAILLHCQTQNQRALDVIRDQLDQ